MAYRLQNYPLINQEAAPTADGQADENWANNCGWSCVSGALLWTTGVLIEPDTLKDAGMGQGALGYSYVNQLSDCLNAHDITTHYEQVADNATARQMADSWGALGHPVIELFFSNRVAQTGGHFVTQVGVNADTSRVVANPWGGFFETLQQRDWDAAYNKWLLHVVAGEHRAAAPQYGPRYLITRDMNARNMPDLNAVIKPIQGVAKGAVLNGTGRQTSHWVEVVAGGRPVWVWLGNTTAV